MFSNVIKSALEREIVGQQTAVNGVVRGVTRAASGLVPRDGPRCAYMLMGPSGTGKTHLVRTLSRALHGDLSRLVVADCTHYVHGDPWIAFVMQIAPLFSSPRMENRWAVAETAPLSIILIEYLERSRPEVVKALAAALETGRVTLPEGRLGSLRNCLVFLTSSLCTREILDNGPRIGFSGSQGEEAEEYGGIHKACWAAAQKHYGMDLMERLDSLLIFHGLGEEHLSEILNRIERRVNAFFLAPRGFTCELTPEAKKLLLDKGHDLRLGARDLVRAFRRFVEFPVADLMISGRIPPGGTILADRRPGEEHLHFTVTAPTEQPADAPLWPTLSPGLPPPIGRIALAQAGPPFWSGREQEAGTPWPGTARPGPALWPASGLPGSACWPASGALGPLPFGALVGSFQAPRPEPPTDPPRDVPIAWEDTPPPR